MKISSRIKKLDFVGFPRKVSLENYEQQKQNIIHYFKYHPSISSIYQIGDVNHPSISDLDVVLVLKGNGYLTKEDYIFIDMLDNYIFLHSPFIIQDCLFPYINYLFYATNLKRLDGEEFTFKIPATDEDFRKLMWTLSVEAALSRLSDIIYQVSCMYRISIRKMLLKINSIKHNINLYKALIQNPSEETINFKWDRFIKRIMELRNNWFNYNKEQQIKETSYSICAGIEVLVDIIDRLASQSAEIFGPYSVKKKSPCFVLFPNTLQIYKFDSRSESKINFISNPLFVFSKISNKKKYKIAKHVNDIASFSFSDKLMILFRQLNDILKNQSKKKSISILTPEKHLNVDLEKPDLPEIIKFRYQMINIYRTFLEKRKITNLSPLLMAPWLSNNKAKFFYVKRACLKGLIRFRLA